MSTKLESDLIAAMHAETDGLVVPGQIVEHAARSVRRRRATLASAGLSAIVAATAVVAITMNGITPSRTSPNTGLPVVLTAADVQRNAASAFDDEILMHVTTTAGGSGQVNQIWVDLVTGNLYRFDDTRQVWIAVSHGTATMTEVDKQRHTWSRTVYQDAKSIERALDNRAASVRSELKNGHFTLVGHDTIAGIDTLHLHTDADREDIWVDATTFRTIRETVAVAPGPITVDFQWLDRTPDQLARFTVTIPAGYTRLR
jgi:hypothetical protein